MRFNLRALLLVVRLGPLVVIGLIEYVDSSTDLQYYAAYATSGTWLDEAVG